MENLPKVTEFTETQSVRKLDYKEYHIANKCFYWKAIEEEHDYYSTSIANYTSGQGNDNCMN